MSVRNNIGEPDIVGDKNSRPRLARGTKITSYRGVLMFYARKSRVVPGMYVSVDEQVKKTTVTFRQHTDTVRCVRYKQDIGYRSRYDGVSGARNVTGRSAAVAGAGRRSVAGIRRERRVAAASAPSRSDSICLLSVHSVCECYHGGQAWDRVGAGDHQPLRSAAQSNVQPQPSSPEFAARRRVAPFSIQPFRRPRPWATGAVAAGKSRPRV